MTSKITVTEIHNPDAYMELLLKVDPSREKVKAYLAKSTCFVAILHDRIIGICVLMQKDSRCFEIMNISVMEEEQRKGIGTQLLRHAILTCKTMGASKLEVGTGSFGYQLTFYQREGFRVHSIDKDFFLSEYDEPVLENGIQLKDMLRLTLEL